MSDDRADVIKDAAKTHWVYRAPKGMRPYLQLSRLDRPIGYWLLALPGWIGLAFGSLAYGFDQTDLKWALLILIGAIAMRGAGCTYNDIVDQDLDAQVERTALRPLPAGTVSTKQAWIWLFAQCAVGLVVLLCLPRLAQIISLASIPLVAAYPFMKRITWWPQLWLGMTFNWAVLVAYAAKTGTVSAPLFILYAGLIFWTVGYDTIYACQDIEDDAMIGVRSTARRFGSRVKLGVGICYFTSLCLILIATPQTSQRYLKQESEWFALEPYQLPLYFFPFIFHLVWQVVTFDKNKPGISLLVFKSNAFTAFLLITALVLLRFKFETAWIPDFVPPKLD